MLIKTRSYSFYFWAIGALGKGLSGSDRIFIELARRWQKVSPVHIFVWTEGYRMCQRQRLSGSNIFYQVLSMKPWNKLGFVVNYLARIIEGFRFAISLKLVNEPSTIIYSASEFWMDSLPCAILKQRFPKIIWMAAWYQTAPNPLKGFSEGERKERFHMKAFLYWFVQLPIKPIIAKFADFVLVNNDLEKRQFSGLNVAGRAITVPGAVNLRAIQRYKKLQTKLYDVVFQGRFHPQKGVLELVDIWSMVVKSKPDAKLVMIGDGPLMKNVKIKIQKSKLEDNIILTGYLFDGDEKYKIFSQSKIVVHPAFYDSGGMAAAEAMAFGIPAVGFNLESFKYYYPKGMIKVKVGDLKTFSNKIIELLNNNLLRQKLGKEAQDAIKSSWSWNKRASEVLDRIEMVI